MADGPSTPENVSPSNRNLNNPAHMASSLQPIDLNPSIQITQHELNGLNFREWYQSVLLVIKGKGKMGYLTGTFAAPPITEPSYSNWDAENSIVMAWLINSMEPKIGSTYLFCKTAHEIWTTIQEMYSDFQNSAQCFDIRSALRNTRQVMARNRLILYRFVLKRQRPGVIIAKNLTTPRRHVG
ncbi:Gag-polypeptide of LTR copia-type [Sesbania bispinosa]|nr:Gag-polypeptide of LTR copia-type [Sesbania bispinosa]